MITKLQQRLRAGLPASTPQFLGELWPRVVNQLSRARLYAREYLRHTPLSRLSLSDLPPVQTVTVLVLAFGGIAAVGGYLAINSLAIAPLQKEVDRAAGEVSSVLTESIDRQIAVAESAAALFSGPNTNINRWAFLEFSRSLPDDIPGLSAIEWLPRVTKKQRSEFKKSANTDGLFDFQFVERTADGGRRTASQRAEYYPVFYVEPYAGNEAVLGLDLAADRKVAEFLADVRDTGKIVVASAELMSGDSADRSGFSIVVPVFRSSIIPVTVAERQAALSGFVRTNFRFDRLLESLRSRVTEFPDLEVYIFDRDAGNAPSLIHAFSSQLGNLPDRPISAKEAYQGAFTTVDHEVGGRRWSVVVKPLPSAFQNVVGLTAWGFVAFTLLLTALLLRQMTTMHRAKEQAEAANRAKTEFLAMMGHELRTPLTAVIGFSEMMVGELFGPMSNEHYKQYTAHINGSAMHLLDLISNILDLSKVEDGSYVLEEDDFVLAEIWRSAFSVLEGSIGASGVKVDEDLSKSSLMLHADPVVFRRILLNLVSNAIKFTDQGGRVSVTAGVGSDGQFTLQITDNGIGIAKEHLDLVLKPFRQVDNTLSRKYEGIGVGLPLTRKLVELHGGELRLNSGAGEGTEVTVTFPGHIVVADDTPGEKPAPAHQDNTPADRVAAAPEDKAVASR